MEGALKAGVKNAMVVALDDETKAEVEKNGFVAHRMTLEVGVESSLASSRLAQPSLAAQRPEGMHHPTALGGGCGAPETAPHGCRGVGVGRLTAAEGLAAHFVSLEVGVADRRAV